VFGERSQGGNQLDGGAGNKTASQGQLLVHHGENAAGIGVHDDDAAGLRAEGIDGGAANGEIVAIHVIARSGIHHRNQSPNRFLLLDLYLANSSPVDRSGSGELKQAHQEQRADQESLHFVARKNSWILYSGLRHYNGMAGGGVNLETVITFG